ncbi:MAG: PQQ-dependent sugar dehydrogenase [Candidatus Thermoplasmatota archaeon]
MRQSRLALLVFVLVLAVLAAAMAYVLLSSSPSPPRIGSYTFEVRYSNLNWVDALAFAPDGRIFFAERLSGSIRIIRGGSLLPTPFFSFANVDFTGERGLLGLALAPGFPQDPWMYAYYTHHDTANDTFENRIVKVQASGDNGTAMQILLDGIPSATIHNGGVIVFGPDGKLWVVVGDGAVPSSAQDLSALTGKVLRLNPNGSVPSDNPFAGNASANPYVYSYGHRNMFGIAFHPVTHSAYVTENGPSDSDEINLLVAGGNYGWPIVRGIAHTPPYLDPVLAYTPVIVPTNAVFYTGSVYGLLEGDLLFGDYANHRLHDLELAPPDYDVVTIDSTVATVPSGIVGVAQSPDGYVWVTTASAMYRLVPVTGPAAAQAALPIAFCGLAVPASPRNLSKGHAVPTRNAGVPHRERGPPQGVPRAVVRNPA